MRLCLSLSLRQLGELQHLADTRQKRVVILEREVSEAGERHAELMKNNAKRLMQASPAPRRPLLTTRCSPPVANRILPTGHRLLALGAGQCLRYQLTSCDTHAS